MSTDVVGSKQPAFASDQKSCNAGFGQNGFTGPSSDTPGKRTTSGFLPGPGAPVNDQLRTAKADPYPTTFGMKKR